MLAPVAAACAAAGAKVIEYVAIDGDRAALAAGLDALVAAGSATRVPPPPRPPLRRDAAFDAADAVLSGVRVSLTLVACDALDCDVAPAFDLVVACAFADLVFPEALAGGLGRLGRPGAAAYLPCTFAGAASLDPPLSVGLDDGAAFAAYHASLVESGQKIDAARLTAVLAREGFEVDARPGDWRVALGSGAPAEDAAFAPYLADFYGAGGAPRFFATEDAEDALAWFAALAQAAGGAGPRRTLVVRNLDLLLRFPDAGEVATDDVTNRPTRSHRRGDSLAKYLDALSQDDY